jgi:hypothetical protein
MSRRRFDRHGLILRERHFVTTTLAMNPDPATPCPAAIS